MSLRSKIAALPESIRDEFNRRLADGLSGPPILAWLNELPEVRSVIAERFHGEPVSRSNLAQWRKSGFQQWLDGRSQAELVRDLSAESSNLILAHRVSIAEGAAVLTSARLLQAVRNCTAADHAPLANIAHALFGLRSAEATSQRLRLCERAQQRFGSYRVEAIHFTPAVKESLA